MKARYQVTQGSFQSFFYVLAITRVNCTSCTMFMDDFGTLVKVDYQKLAITGGN